MDAQALFQGKCEGLTKLKQFFFNFIKERKEEKEGRKKRREGGREEPNYNKNVRTTL